MDSYGELWRATECYKELWKDMRATESYGELWVPMAKQCCTTLLFDCSRPTKSYGELRRATESYGNLWLN